VSGDTRQWIGADSFTSERQLADELHVGGEIQMVAASENMLGVGLYSIEEIALYARVSRKLANRWFFGSKEGGRTITPRIIDGKFVSFLDFVQMMAIREIRQAHRVSLKKIRQLLDIAENERDIQYPFASKGITFLWGDNLGLKLPDGKMIEASGMHRRNILLKEVVVLYKEDLGYDPSGIANLYHAFKWDDCAVEMNPRLRFGEPIVKSCGYTAQTLWEAAKDEGSVEGAARAYGVDKKEVETACRYFDMLQGKAA
jgi:uncharacterized protein (DUF433 family)